MTITGGTVEAWGGEQAAGIGGAYLRDSCPVTIAGGTVTAYGGNTGAGIGSGCGGNSTTDRYTTGNIKISGGTVTANGGYFAAGIGGGEYNTAGDILISGGTVIAKRDASKDSGTMNPAKDVGDGATNSNEDRAKVYARYTLNGSAKLYLQSGFINYDPLDTIKPSINSGYIFNGTPDTYKEIRVYGSQTLSENFCIETGKKMTVTNGASLNANSKLYVKGTLAKEDTGSASGNIYYPLTLVKCTAGSSNTSNYGDSNELFGKANAAISLTPALQSGYKLESWTVTPDTVTVSNNSFTMPQQATTVEAVGTQAVTITQQPQNQEITYGADVTLSVTAQNASGNTSGIFYNWYVDGVLKGNGSSLTLSKLGAGSHSCYCQVSCDGVSMNSNTVTVTVNKAQASVTINSAPNKTYDGQPAVLTNTMYTTTGDGKVTVEYVKKGGSDYDTNAPTDAGDYTVLVTLHAGTNFTEASDTENFTISKATDNAWLTAPTVTNFTYGDTVNPVTYKAKYGNDKVKITYKKQGTEDAPSTDVPTEAGTYDVTFSVEETSNYSPKLEATNLTLTIAKADSSVTTAPTDAQSLYDGSPVSLVIAGTADGGTMKYRLGEDGEWTDTIPTATNWQTYTVYYKVVGDNNHNDTEPQPVKAEIVPFKIQTQPADMGIEYGTTTELAVILNDNAADVSGITYQWCLVTMEDGQEVYTPLEGETGSSLTLTKPIAGSYTYVCKITCGEYSATSAEAVVTVTAVKETLPPTTDLPSGLWVEGGEKPLNGNSIDLKSPSSRLLTQYSEKKNTQGDPYPSGMKVFVLNEDNQPEEIPALENLLQYSGCSIRINGKPGIRMITSLTKEAKELLKKGELAGYTLEAYGTVAQWSKNLGEKPLTLSTGNSNYAYKKGVSDPVFANVGNLTQYTNVLVWDSLPDEKLAQDILMRPYIILSNEDGETVTLYGGTVSRSIGYVAQQNADTFPVGSAGYNYVHDIIDRVANLNQSNESTTTAGGNG